MCSAPPTVLDIIAIVAMMSLHRKATADTAAIWPSRFSHPAGKAATRRKARVERACGHVRTVAAAAAHARNRTFRQRCAGSEQGSQPRKAHTKPGKEHSAFNHIPCWAPGRRAQDSHSAITPLCGSGHTGAWHTTAVAGRGPGLLLAAPAPTGRYADLTCDPAGKGSHPPARQPELIVVHAS